MKKGWQWPVAICGFLSLTIIVDVTTLYVASTHSTLAAEPDYYARSMRWDADQAERAKGALLGWQLDIVEFATKPSGFSEISVGVKSATGDVLSGLAVSLEAFHVTRPKQPVHVTLAEVAPGFYVARLSQARRLGPWQLNFRCRSGPDMTFHELRHSLKAE